MKHITIGKTIVAFAVACACSPALALMDSEFVPATGSGGGGGGGWGGGGATYQMPTVNVIGTRIQWSTFTATGPMFFNTLAPSYPIMTGRWLDVLEPLPAVSAEDAAKKKADCVNNCNQQRVINDNACLMQTADLRGNWFYAAPIFSTAVGAAVIWKRGLTDWREGLAFAGTTYVVLDQVAEKAVTNSSNACAANSAATQNKCLQETCKA